MKNAIYFALVGGLCLVPAARGATLVDISLVPTNLVGNPISTIHAGQPFQLEAIVQDVRNPPANSGGVFAAYLNANYDKQLVSIDPHAAFTYGPTFTPPLAPGGDVSTPGEILGAGAASLNLSAPGASPQLLWILPATASSAGLETFDLSFDSRVGHDVLIYGDDFTVTADQIQFQGAQLTIVPEPSGFALAGICSLAVLGWSARRRPTRA